MVERTVSRWVAGLFAGAVTAVGASAPVWAQDQLPWQSQQAQYQPQAPAYNQGGYNGSGAAPDPYRANNRQVPPPVNRYNYGQSGDNYQAGNGYGTGGRGNGAGRQQPTYPQYGNAPRQAQPQRRYIEPYRPPAQQPQYRRYGANEPYQRNYGNSQGGGARYYNDREPSYRDSRPRMPSARSSTYSENEVVDAGHRFFGSLSNGLAKAIQWAFKRSGRPNGYILGEDAGGAFVAGLRYGEGKLFTKNYGVRRVFWQGPSIGYDFGGDGNRTMTLVYNLRSPGDVYRRFGGVQGSAYLVGGVSVQFLKAGGVTLAPIRTGVGLRLGANVGYLKFTRRATWNPF